MTNNSFSKPRLVSLKQILDYRGSLCIGEFEKDIPFAAKRYFLIQDVPQGEKRGQHAHLTCQQFLVVVKGSLTAIVDNGIKKEEHVLNSPYQGLYMPAMVWGTQYNYSQDAVLLVFASEYYDAEDYIHDYQAFLDALKNKPQL